MLVFQAQRLEDLAETLLVWLNRYPAGPLEGDTILVPSNGLAEWFKTEAALTNGIFAGSRVELPARFVWRIYQQVLGPATSRRASAFDKAVLPWRLAATRQQWSGIPSVAEQLKQAEPGGMPDTAAVFTGHAWPEGSHAGPDARVLQPQLWRWCRQVADLYDQYQLYRGDWLTDWAAGDARLRLNASSTPAPHNAVSLPPEYRWQADLWHWLEVQMDGGTGTNEPGSRLSRPALHRACIQALQSGAAATEWRLPPRIVLFGATTLAPPHLELLQALSRHVAVVLAVPNPCRVQWVDLADAAAQGQPLLAAWGKQTRDFLMQIEASEAELGARKHGHIARAERDDPIARDSALRFLQAAIHLNEPLSESATALDTAGQAPALQDGSMAFAIAHTPLREVEILHDHLLHRLAQPPSASPPQPRDVVVMVPDLARYAPAIRAVFGGLLPSDPRYIPWGLADQQAHPEEGLCRVVGWLLSLPSQRCTGSELLELLQVPALAQRWGLDAAQRDRLCAWVAESGIRWGLTEAHRHALGLGAAGNAMTWRFGIDRMLAGYAMGGADVSDAGVGLGSGPAPMETVRGLEAQAAGQLAAILNCLERWRLWALRAHSPSDWVAAIRSLLMELFEPTHPSENQQSRAIEEALSAWLRATAQAQFDDAVPLEIVREAWLSHLQTPSSSGRFRAGGVTFCTLMPLRTIPFRVVCWLGMNDGDYPRPSAVATGDLMARTESARPGDRSRRADDRQLLLDALLSARDHLYCSWVGRRASDNEAQPPSVLVGQLRDTLQAIWGSSAVQDITTEHPLHAYSAQYFEPGPLPQTHAHEWEPVERPSQGRPSAETPKEDRLVEEHAVTSGHDDNGLMERWLKCPVSAFWADRLGVRWRVSRTANLEDEPMVMAGLEGWPAWAAAVDRLTGGADPSSADPHDWAASCWVSLERQGLVPLGAPAAVLHKPAFISQVAGLMGRWHEAQRHEPLARVHLTPSRFLQSAASASIKLAETRLDRLLPIWWTQLHASARGEGAPVALLAPDATAWADPLGASAARDAIAQVQACLERWRLNDEPMPATARLMAAWQGPASKRKAAFALEAERNPAWRRSFGGPQDWAWHEGAVGRPWPQWATAMDELYGPFWHWCSTQLRARRV